MKGAIALPTSSHFYALKQPMFCLLNLMLELKDKNWDIKIIVNELPWIEDARNNLLKQVDPDVDWVLMLDSDITFQPQQAIQLIKRLHEDNLDMLTGIYYMGSEPHAPVIYQKKDKTITYYTNHPNKDIFEVIGCGLGFCVVSGQVLRSLPANPFNRLSSWEDKEIGENKLGEDLSFCKRVLDNGYKIKCDPTIKVGHIRLNVISNRSLSSEVGE